MSANQNAGSDNCDLLQELKIKLNDAHLPTTLMWMGRTKLFLFHNFSISDNKKNHVYYIAVSNSGISKSRTKMESSAANTEFINNLEVKCRCLFINLMTETKDNSATTKTSKGIERLASF